MTTGLLGDDRGGRIAATATPRARLDGVAEGASGHGIAASGGQDPDDHGSGARFGRMFPYLPARDPGLGAIDKLVDAMATLAAKKEDPENTKVPAGYTYLGQFVDHDITFDPGSRFGHANEPSALVNFRTPRFDLDSLYGAGPVGQPYLYDWCDERPGAKLLMKTNAAGDLARHDLPRNEHGRALIGDARNDENLILAQLHLLFLRFHNAVVDRLGPRSGLPGPRLFEEARRIVRWHYQWIVVHDFLRKVVGDLTADATTPRPAAGSCATASTRPRRLYPWRDVPVIPVEFSGAAYRFGHSMVRPAYNLNDLSGPEVSVFPDPSHPENPLHLGGFRPLLRALRIEWDRFFFPFPAHGRQINSKKLDHYVADPLFHLPIRFTLGDVPRRSNGAPPTPAPETTRLARLNMHRGVALGLPAGADVACELDQPVLTRLQLFPPSLELDDETKDAIEDATPLWFYLLREAATYGRDGKIDGPAPGFQLGPIGGRIVAEVLVGLLESDPQSYINQDPPWTPALCLDLLPGLAPADHPEKLSMIDLVRFTTAGDDA